MIADIIKPGHAYRLQDGNRTSLVFRHHDARLGGVLVDGTTTCELIEILIHRINTLNQGDAYCIENVATILDLHGALANQKARKARLTAQGGAAPSVQHHGDTDHITIPPAPADLSAEH